MKKFLSLAVLLATVISASAAITHGSAQRAALAQSILDSIGSPARIVLLQGSTPLDTVTGTFTRAGAVLTLQSTPVSSTVSVGGTINTFRVLDAGTGIVFTGSVATSAADLIVDNATVVPSQTVNITSMSYTAAP